MTPVYIKLACILLYGGFGGACLYKASDGRRLARLFDANAVFGIVPAVIAAGILMFGFAITGSHLLLVAAAIGTVIFSVRHRERKALLPGASAVVLVLSLAWWRMEPSAANLLPLAAFAIVLGGLTVGFADPGKRCVYTLAVPLGAFLIAGFLLLIDLGGYRPDTPILSLLAHHWGAFIGPALHLQAGLVPFYDVPLQYGLGPTLVIAAACGGTNCWTSTECVVIVMNLAVGLLILRMVLATSVSRGWIWQYAATIVVFAAVFLWTGIPANGSSVLATPSVGGLRFLPVTLVAFLLFFGRPGIAAVALIPAVLWSPESAAMSIAVFGLCETARIGFIPAFLRSAGVLVGSYACLVLLHRATFGVWMDPMAFAEYVLHVPGPLPINPFSDALLLVAVLGLGGWLVLRPSSDPTSARRDRSAVFLLLAATSYWLGRSHPNNVCNLAPFLVLVGFRVLDRGHSMLADVTCFGLATSVAALAMSPWHSVPYDFRATVDIHGVVADLVTLEPDVEMIRATIVHPEGLGIADFGPNYVRHPSEKIVWTPMDPSSLWSYVPSERRQVYIRRSAARIRRAGWAIVDEAQGFLFDDLLAGYEVAEQHSFVGSQGHYIVACFNPRSEIAASIVGPACPRRTP